MTLLELLLEHQTPWPEDADFCYLEGNSIIFRRDSDNQLICVASHRYSGIPYGNRVSKREYLMAKGQPTVLEILLEELDEWPTKAAYAYQRYFSYCITFEDNEGKTVKLHQSQKMAGSIGEASRATREEYLASKKNLKLQQKGEDMNNLAAYAHALELLRKFEEHISATMPEGEGYVPFEQLKIDLEWHYNLKPAVAEMSKSIDWEDYNHEDKETILRVLKDVAKAGFRKQEK